MKIVMIYDQIQAGVGTKDDSMTPLGLNKGATGPAVIMEPSLKKLGAQMLACLYCGHGFYQANQEEVKRKMCAMVEKLQADIVICGPCFDYKGYAQMAAELASAINQKTQAKAFAAMAEECQDTIADYKEEVPIVKIPKKGAAGLNQALENIVELAAVLNDQEKLAQERQKFCY